MGLGEAQPRLMAENMSNLSAHMNSANRYWI